MELVFIRHGQGEHTLDTPESLQIPDPSLTERGKEQARALQDDFTLTEDDLIVVSPVRRTLQTADIWSRPFPCKKVVHPLVSPRMFPQKEGAPTLPCDRMLDRETIQSDFPAFQIAEPVPESLWNEGINTMEEESFRRWAEEWLKWCEAQHPDRLYVVSHDGTITSYRQYMSGKSLTRNDFPKETSWFKQPW
ncbi:phosphoglycerate mutase family protein [Halobacillus litoralis]|uniref:histidine phosphatase family protein n=1 Tax=Halobacillus litoralis TaxID=45668 RepID=UPI001CD1B94F|nr:histidine phosphatase family protein [Halobacillus litoralis]MCA0972533.1 phosphoglycerate mutase family protein [Halobacillus litoralis]